MAKDSVLNATLKVQSRLTKLESIPNNNEKKVICRNQNPYLLTQTMKHSVIIHKNNNNITVNEINFYSATSDLNRK